MAINFVPRTPFLTGHSRPRRKVEPGDEDDGHENERLDNLKGLSLKIVIKKCAKNDEIIFFIISRNVNYLKSIP